MKKNEKARSDQRRASVANEAARIILDEGLNDFRSAKEKALERLGLLGAGTLPTNAEIELAIAERNRIFRGDRYLSHLEGLRRAALTMMRSLTAYHPRLVGPVLSGHTTEYSSIDLHLFNDSAEAVGFALDMLNIKHRLAQFRYRFRRGEAERFPGYRFGSADGEFFLTVFPELRRHSPPLSPVNGRPMPRADLRELERLLAT